MYYIRRSLILYTNIFTIILLLLMLLVINNFNFIIFLFVVVSDVKQHTTKKTRRERAKESVLENSLGFVGMIAKLFFVC